MTQTQTYDLLTVDPPWYYPGDPNAMGAAGKHYQLMPDVDVLRLDVRSYIGLKGMALVWATCPRMDFAIDAIRAWGLHYRGVAFVWVKTRKDGAVIGAQGIRACVTKATSELLLVASTNKKGRPLKIADESVAQVVLAPRGEHSEKPAEVYRRIERMYPDASKCELFARAERPGWACVGDELPVPSRVRMRPAAATVTAG